MKENKFLTPFQKFVKVESFSGILLFSATLIALIWANSPWADVYQSLWQYKVGFQSDGFALNKPLILWVNDGLMAIFFFLIGLEIKRELLIGELNSLRKAALPFFAAMGGMFIPILCYFLFNSNPETSVGWGIPMATDIAFSLAILKLLGNRVPLSLKVFLTAFAIVDDLGAVMIIGIFYSSGLDWSLLSIGLAILVILYSLSYLRFYLKYLVFLAGALVWLLFLKAGIHPTLAGVLVAFAVPIRQKIDIASYSDRLVQIVDAFRSSPKESSNLLSKEQIKHLDQLDTWTEEVQSPLQSLEHTLHGWVAYFIMPIFALANTGIMFGGGMALDQSLILSISLSLLLGKSLGVVLFSFLGIALNLAELPKDVNRLQILGVGLLSGVGFTMAIFIAGLAFGSAPEFIDSAKIGILLGSLVAGVLGYVVLRLSSNPDKELS
ncbi:MAG: Na+/H+ antiporter NhaA [Bacteroidota bacterium]